MWISNEYKYYVMFINLYVFIQKQLNTEKFNHNIKTERCILFQKKAIKYFKFWQIDKLSIIPYSFGLFRPTFYFLFLMRNPF